jgi:PAS domain S-box-containing protein
MAAATSRWIQDHPRIIPALITGILAAAFIVHYLLLQMRQTLIFDALFYFPIILIAYYYPRRGLFFSFIIACAYMVMVWLQLPQSTETVITSLEHAGLFIIIGYVVSYLSIHSPHELAIYKRLAAVIEPSRMRVTVIPALIAILSAVIIFLNFLVLQASDSVIFDPLFYFPIIIAAYFYPRKGVFFSAGIAFVFLVMVMVVPNQSTDIMITACGHAGIFIIIGFVVSYLSIRFSKEHAIHKRLADIVESTSDAIIGKTVDGMITDWNKGADRLFGYSAPEIIGKPITLLFPSERQEDNRVLLEKILLGEHVPLYETELTRKDHERIQVSLSVSPIKNTQNEIIGASVIAHDITERRQMENALEQANKKLQLLNSITRHDIINQIMALNNCLDMTDESLTDPGLRPLIRKAKTAADNISQQISFTREYQDIGVKKPEWRNVDASIRNAAGSLDSGTVVIDRCDKTLEVFSDPLFDKVFYNLIDNSLRHGEKLTRIRITHREEPDGLILAYEDDGVGISAEDKKKIFTKGFGRNTGLGLFLIREILAITRITITENGVPGTGVRFEIHVPKDGYRFNGNTDHPL